MDTIFLGTIQRGNILLQRKEKFIDYLRSLDGKEIELIVRRLKKKRSKQQNRYYWGVVVELLCETTGYNEEEMHESLKMLFLKDLTRKIPTLRSTASLTTKEFEKYLARIRMWAAQNLGCSIPEPNEVEF